MGEDKATLIIEDALVIISARSNEIFNFFDFPTRRMMVRIGFKCSSR